MSLNPDFTRRLKTMSDDDLDEMSANLEDYDRDVLTLAREEFYGRQLSIEDGVLRRRIAEESTPAPASFHFSITTAIVVFHLIVFVFISIATGCR